MKIRMIVGLIALALASGSCGYLPLKSQAKDCGYTAHFDAPEQGKAAWMTISRVLAEELNGELNCGFATTPTRVDKAFINGNRLDIVTIGEDTVYVAPVDFDPGKHELNIEVDGKTYRSDPQETQRTGKRYVLALRRAGQ